MAIGFLAGLFRRRLRLPRDRVTRIPRAAKKAGKPHVDAMLATITKIGALNGMADIKEQRRVPRGFYALVAEFLAHYDAYVGTVRPFLAESMAPRPGEPGGCQACHAVPMGVHGIESLSIYRHIREWKDFPQVAQRMATLGETQFKLIQAGHTGKDPEKIRMGSKAVQQGRLAYARQKQPCPFLDVGKERCRVWEHRPMVCRMHYPTTDPSWSDPASEHYPEDVRAFNIRAPLKVQVSLAQLDKRMSLQSSPFMHAAVLQLAQLAEGGVLQEVGEAPIRMGQDGRVPGRANRNVSHAKKFKKRKKKKG